MKKIEKQILSLDERIKNIENSSASLEKETKKGNNKLITDFLLKAFLPILSIIISIFAIFLTENNNKRNLEYIKTNTELSQKEYEYKIDPEYDFYAKISIEGEEMKVKDFRIEISKENNLENIYILNSNGIIKKEDFSKGYIDLEINDYYKVEFENTKQIYRYIFMITESIDEDLEILLVCSKVDSKTNETNTFIKNYLELYEFRNEEIGKVIFNQYNDLKNYIKEYKLN